MRFARPELLWLVLALPVLALVGLVAARWRRRALERFAGGGEYAGRFLTRVSAHRRSVKVLLLYLALAAALLAAARPQWGSSLEPITRRGVDVVVLLDNSLSMAAEDVAPSRLAFARHAVDSLLTELAGDRVALVTFAGQASLLCPLTLDHAAVRLFLDAVDVEVVQVPGTALAEALQTALGAFGERHPAGGERTRAIVLFTDGEDHEGKLDEAAAHLAGEGVVVYAVGCGTTRGAPIPLTDPSGSRSGYKKDGEGKVVTTRLEEGALEKLALATGGRYYRGTATEAEINEVARAVGGLDATEFGTALRTRYTERFQLPLGLALLALGTESLLGDRRSGRAPAARGSEG